MTIPEQAGKAIEALKTSPGLLVLVLLQAGIMAMIYFSASHSADLWQARQMALIERCYPHQKE